MNDVNYWVVPAIKYKEQKSNQVIDNVCKHFEITKDELVCKDRTRKYVEARSILCYLLCIHKNMTTLEIGKLLNRSHCTVIHQRDKIRGYMQFDRGYDKLVNSFI